MEKQNIKKPLTSLPLCDYEVNDLGDENVWSPLLFFKKIELS